MTSHTWDHPPVERRESNSETYQPSTYFYDLKLAEFIRQNQYPPCIHLNPPPCQSMSTDYGFGSSEPFSSSASYASTTTLPPPEGKMEASEWHLENTADRTTQPSSTIPKQHFVSSEEYVV